MYKHDPQEDDPRLGRITRKAEVQVEKNLESYPKHFGFCHRHWEEKKRILKETYGISWKSPADMNPEICFD
tara:strand:- start:641 stop:853 length:213 start_codon:yes stop_codon:yes gene_type:complete